MDNFHFVPGIRAHPNDQRRKEIVKKGQQKSIIDGKVEAIHGCLTTLLKEMCYLSIGFHVY